VTSLAGVLQVDDRDSGTASDDETLTHGAEDGDIVDLLMLHSLTAAAAAGACFTVSLFHCTRNYCLSPSYFISLMQPRISAYNTIED